MSESYRYSTFGTILLVIGIVYLCIGWLPFLGLKINKPQEALVLTLFGKYDELGNPVEICIVVIWRDINTAMAVFNVDNFKSFLSIQCDSSLRNIARLYPYDQAAGGEKITLRGSSQEVAEKLKVEIQSRVDIADLEIIEARITHLADAPEIAAVMLQRSKPLLLSTRAG